MADNISFISMNIPFPKADQDTFLQQTIEDLLHLLKHKNNLKIPAIMFGDKIWNAISEIAYILNRNKNEIMIRSKEPRVVPVISTNNKAETRVKNQKIQKREKKNYNNKNEANAIKYQNYHH